MPTVDGMTGLKLRNGIWCIHKRVPKALVPHYGKKFFLKSLKTRNRTMAKVLYQEFLLEVDRTKIRLGIPSDDDDFNNWLGQIRNIKRGVSEEPTVASPAPPIEISVCLNTALDKHKELNKHVKYNTLKRWDRACIKFLEHLNLADIELHKISRLMVFNWMMELEKEYSKKTVNDYVTTLKTIYDTALHLELVDKSNPFANHKIRFKSSIISYKTIDDELNSKCLSLLSDEAHSIWMIGMYTGARLGEICGMLKKDIINVDGILCFNITDGKTDNAKRLIPIHDKLLPLVETLLTTNTKHLLPKMDRIQRKDGKPSNYFSTYIHKKLKGVLSTRQCFHSHRVNVITQLDNAGVPEDTIALLVGHSRGKTESFRTYSRAMKLETLRDTIHLVSYFR